MQDIQGRGIVCNQPYSRLRGYVGWVTVLVAAMLLLWAANSRIVLSNTVAKDKSSFGSLQTIRSAIATGPLRVDPTNPRYFTDGSGRAILLSGSHFWLNLQDGGPTNDPPLPFNYDQWLNFLQANNHNFFRLWAWEQAKWVAESSTPYYFLPNIYLRPGPGTALDGKPKFDVTQLNQAYFDRMRQRIIDAGNRGIYVSIMLFDGWSVTDKGPYGGQANTWLGHPFNPANNSNSVNGDPGGYNDGLNTEDLSIPAITALQETYVRKVIDTVNDLPNVLYEICNECADGTWQRTDSTNWEYHFINFIHNYEATKPYQHPVGMTEIAASDASLFNSNAEWISPHDNGSITNPTVSTGAKVEVLDTDHICGICGNRAWVWKSFTNGNNMLFMDQYDDSYKLNGGGYNMNNPNDVSLRANLGYVLTYSNRINLTLDVPHGELTSTGYALANPTSEYLVYAPAGGQFTVNLSATSGTLKIEWFNPSNGTTTSGGTVKGGATRSFTAPFSGDAVLYLCKTTSAPPPTPFPGNFFIFLPFIQGSLSQSLC